MHDETRLSRGGNDHVYFNWIWSVHPFSVFFYSINLISNYLELQTKEHGNDWLCLLHRMRRCRCRHNFPRKFFFSSSNFDCHSLDDFPKIFFRKFFFDSSDWLRNWTNENISIFLWRHQYVYNYNCQKTISLINIKSTLTQSNHSFSWLNCFSFFYFHRRLLNTYEYVHPFQFSLFSWKTSLFRRQIIRTYYPHLFASLRQLLQIINDRSNPIRNQLSSPSNISPSIPTNLSFFFLFSTVKQEQFDHYPKTNLISRLSLPTGFLPRFACC